MRRNEFSVNDQEEIEAFLAEATYGFLGTVGEDGCPHITPLNFVYLGGNIYFHGSRAGQKMADLKRLQRVTFCVAKEYAIIPSYFTDPKFACPATAYFKSVIAKGSAAVVEDLEEKAEALEAFMKKLQPEGGYDPITTKDEEYVSRIKGVAVVKIEVENLTAKFKFGQNLKDNVREKVTDALQQRQNELDEETIELMRKYCPAHRD